MTLRRKDISALRDAEKKRRRDYGLLSLSVLGVVVFLSLAFILVDIHGYGFPVVIPHSLGVICAFLFTIQARRFGEACMREGWEEAKAEIFPIYLDEEKL